MTSCTYHIIGYIRSRNIHRTAIKFSKVVFLYSHTKSNFCSSASGVSRSFIFAEVMLFKKFNLLCNHIHRHGDTVYACSYNTMITQ